MLMPALPFDVADATGFRAVTRASRDAPTPPGPMPRAYRPRVASARVRADADDVCCHLRRHTCYADVDSFITYA